MIDISRAISPEALVYPGDDPIRLEPLCRLAEGGPYNMLRLGSSLHIATHMDAPRHFFDAGAAVDQLLVERFVCDALVIPVDAPAIGPEHLPAEFGGLALLFRTRHSGPWPAEFDREHVYLTGAAAERIAAGGALIVGIDYLSIDRFGDGRHPAHNALLGSGIPILEGLDLAAAAPGRYRLIALPLRLEGGDGSPVRAVLE